MSRFFKTGLGLCAFVVASAGSAFATETGTALTATATLQTACEASASASIDFGTFAALNSTGTKTGDSSSTFQVACSADAEPLVYADGTRSMGNGTDTIAFNLSQTSGAANDDLPASSGTAEPVTLTQDGDLHTVTIYGRIPVANFKAKSSGAYTSSGISLHVVY